MEVRPHRIINRKVTKKIKVGKLAVGGDSPISVQSMTNTLTTDVKATIKQILSLEEAGADIVRVSCPDKESTKALKKYCKRSFSSYSCRHSLSLRKSNRGCRNGGKLS
jgi:(E)-4-hydroxy-3-methylbut-2-enyl-diphosphate synthase